MTDAEFLAFNEAWMAAVLPCLCDGGVFGTASSDVTAAIDAVKADGKNLRPRG